MKRFTELVQESTEQIDEMFPWDLQDRLAEVDILLVDVSEPYEFQKAHITGSINVPRGILESACEYGYEETVPELAAAREREIVVICRSGNRSALAAYRMKEMGFQKVSSIKTGLRGWHDYEQPLVDTEGNTVSPETADKYFTPNLTKEQLGP